MVAKDFPIKEGWQWIFYVLGWIGGALNLVFWAVQVIAYAIQQPKVFFGPMFHRIVMYWGMITLAVVILWIFFFVFLGAFMMPFGAQMMRGI